MVVATLKRPVPSLPGLPCWEGGVPPGKGTGRRGGVGEVVGVKDGEMEAEGCVEKNKRKD